MFPAVGGTLVDAAHNVRRGELNQLAHYVRSDAGPGDLVVVVVQGGTCRFQETARNKRRNVLIGNLHGNDSASAVQTDRDFHLSEDFGWTSDSSSGGRVRVNPADLEPELLPEVFLEAFELGGADQGDLGSGVHHHRAWFHDQPDEDLLVSVVHLTSVPARDVRETEDHRTESADLGLVTKRGRTLSSRSCRWRGEDELVVTWMGFTSCVWFVFAVSSPMSDFSAPRALGILHDFSLTPLPRLSGIAESLELVHWLPL